MKLHLGCWKRNIPGFVHVDLCDLPHIDYQHEVFPLPMFADGEAELIYASHVLEYYDRDEAVEVLKEWRRVLSPGGILRLAVPDFPALVKVYEKTGDLHKILGPLYGKMTVSMEREQKKIIYHKTAYDFISMRTLLESCGFGNVRKYDWRETIHKDVDDYSQAYFPHMDKDHGLLVSLNLEAVKV